MSKTMNFAEAIEALKDGKPVSRTFWNEDGENFLIFKQVPSEIGLEIIPKMTSVPQSVKDILVNDNQTLSYENQVALLNINDGRVDSWNPTVNDIFADDWFIYT